LEILAIVLGTFSGIMHFLAHFLPSIISCAAIVISVAAAELFHYRKSKNFTTAHPPSQDPLLLLLSRFNSLNLVTKLLYLIQLLKPIINFFASIFLTVFLIIGTLNYFYQDMLEDQMLNQWIKVIE
jgi:purine-cytosine permease-like protein